MWLFLIFVLVPIIEIALFIEVGGALGTPWTLAIVVLTALAGSFLLRQQGFQTISRLQNSLKDGENPLNPMAHGALLLVSGVVLITPGFFTDAVGLGLLVPAVRTAVIKWGATRFRDSAHFQVYQSNPQAKDRPNPTTVDADFEVIDEANQKKGDSGWTHPKD